MEISAAADPRGLKRRGSENQLHGPHHADRGKGETQDAGLFDSSQRLAVGLQLYCRSS